MRCGATLACQMPTFLAGEAVSARDVIIPGGAFSFWICTGEVQFYNLIQLLGNPVTLK